MITLAKRPTPLLGASPAPRQYTETDYAELLRRQAIRDGHCKNSMTALDSEYIDAIKDGCYETATIADHVECSVHSAIYRLRKLERLGIVTRKQDRVTQWSLK